MTKKTVVEKGSISGTDPIVNSNDKKDKSSTIPEKGAGKKKKTQLKKSSAFLAESVERSAVDAVEAHSSKDVRGSSGLANTGTIISYD
jgi:hypothetical protein